MKPNAVQDKFKWPYNHEFAFTIFDDTDYATLKNIKPIYSFLNDIGLKITKSVWTLESKVKNPLITGSTCEDKDYLKWLLDIKEKGFEIALHNVTNSSSIRDDTIKGIEKFHEYFGDYPKSFANHADCEESIYWGQYRISGIYRLLYSLIKYKNYNRYRGHVEQDKYFWGDICKNKIKYVRNFTFNDINTLKRDGSMPYHDPSKPYVNYFFSSSNGNDIRAFNALLSEKNQNKLLNEGGACIVYTHLGKGFFSDGKIDHNFKKLLTKLSKKNGWFCTTSELLDFLLDKKNNGVNISSNERKALERRWFFEKIFKGSY